MSCSLQCSASKTIPRPAYPAIRRRRTWLYEYVRDYHADQFIQHDRPEHLEMRKVVHSYFTPRSMEAWRPFVKNAITELLDAAEDQGAHGRHDRTLPRRCPCW